MFKYITLAFFAIVFGFVAQSSIIYIICTDAYEISVQDFIRMLRPNSIQEALTFSQPKRSIQATAGNIWKSDKHFVLHVCMTSTYLQDLKMKFEVQRDYPMLIFLRF